MIRQEEGSENLLRTVISLGRCSPLEFQAGIERWEAYVSHSEKKVEGQVGR